MHLIVPVAFRLAVAEDLEPLEWMGLYTRERAIIDKTFARQKSGQAAMLLAIANGYPIGQAWIDFIERGDAARLWAVRVFPALQGRGLGTTLVTRAERVARAAGAHAMELSVEPENPRALGFYRRLSYVPSGAHGAMRKPLD